MSKTIHVITSIRFGKMYANQKRSPDGIFRSYLTRLNENQKEHSTIISSRTWGWFKKFKDAKQCVKENCTDMHEFEYNYLVIEETEEGFLFLTKEHWYEWDTKAAKWKKSTKPEELKNVVCFWGASKEVR